MFLKLGAIILMFSAVLMADPQFLPDDFGGNGGGTVPGRCTGLDRNCGECRYGAWSDFTKCEINDQGQCKKQRWRHMNQQYNRGPPCTGPSDYDRRTCPAGSCGSTGSNFGSGCNVLPDSMNGKRFEQGCKGAVWSDGSPSKRYCLGNSGRFPWWKNCCKWESNRCIPKANANGCKDKDPKQCRERYSNSCSNRSVQRHCPKTCRQC